MAPPGPDVRAVSPDLPVLDTQVPAPALSSAVSSARPPVNRPLSDTVTVTGAGGAAVPGTWTLLGPVSPVNGGCTQARWAGAPRFESGIFTARNGRTAIHAEDALTQPGCYTFTISLAATATTRAVSTRPGIPAETALLPVTAPSLASAVSAQTASRGGTLVDSVAVASTNGATADVVWKLLGPVAAKDGSCADVNWAGAPAFDTGTFSFTDDGTYPTNQSKPLTAPGCYTYTDLLDVTATTLAAALDPGQPAQTTLVPGLPIVPVTG